MIRTYLAPALAGACMLGLATVSLAATGEFDDMCTMGLAMGKEVKTDCAISAAYEGKTYCFGSEDAKAEFMKDPAANLAKAQEYYAGKHKG
jgi:YHS domain-containing protein